MKKNLLVVTQRNHRKKPGMCCVVEMEDILVKEYGARLLYPDEDLPQGDLSNSFALFTSINFFAMSRDIDFLNNLRQRGATVGAYIYDSWNAKSFFYNKKRRIKRFFNSRYRLSSFCDFLIVPFQESIDEFSEEDRALILHLPLGVDSRMVHGLKEERPFTVLAYGRQPPEIISYFSERLNARGTPFLMHHTDHMQIGDIHDYYHHRRHFWKIAENSAIALAYDPHATHDHRFPYSIVGQRWYECLAAGCAVVGARPTSSETDVLLDWPDATLEAPASAQDTLSLVLDLAGDRTRLADIRERNVTNIQARHDWRVRFQELFDSAFLQ